MAIQPLLNPAPLRIGIDVGGTHTDAVLMREREVLAEVKQPTTRDVTGGIVAALRTLVADGEVEPTTVSAVMIGTTHFTNAVVERRRLEPTACVRLGLPSTRGLPPMTDWPDDLRRALGGHVWLAHGGHEFDGRPISPLDTAELRRIAAEIGDRGIGSVAISSVFSPVNAEFELEVAELFAAELPGVAVSLSHELGRVGLLERENATIMNACLRSLAADIVVAFRSALADFGIEAPVYLSQNDGTLMSVEHTERYPVATFASGPTNSMRGAAFLSGVEDCAVVDIGGTTADVGMLQHGFPREAAVAVDIGGVRTNFRMPDVLSLGIGGGSLVREGAVPRVGPQSVGYELTRRALVFGGAELTASDLAVAAGRARFGDPQRVAGMDEALLRDALAEIEERIAEVVDRMKVSAEPIPVVVVGGGSVLLGEGLPGAAELVKPPHFGVANAIGAAIAQVGGEVDRVVSLDELSRAEALEAAKQEARDKAQDAGAGRGSVRIVDVDEVPLAYLPGSATRIRVKAVGDLELQRGNVARVH
jgi:N-methylhydantoinase A/oxoprolinase/acetone carboxylase beta subunit